MRVHDQNHIYRREGDGVICYEASDEKVKSTDSNVWYYGFLANGGAWIIMEDNRTTGTYRYVAGKTGYVAAFAARETTTFKYFSDIG